MTNPNEQHTDELFASLNEAKQAKQRARRKKLLIVLAVVAVALIAAVLLLRAAVTSRFGSEAAEVLSYEATISTISTTVSGSGSLTQVDSETITVPSDVEITDILVKRGDSMTQGDVLATVNMSTVISSMAAVQEELDALDEEIGDAEGDTVSGTIKAGVSGRVKRVLAAKGDDVAACMVENGALAVISLDGYMALELSNDTLAAGDTVTVTRASGATLTGTVESAINGTAVILVTDNGPEYGEEVTVTDSEGTELGTATLYIHNPLSITGIAGTVSTVSAKENAKVSASTTLFSLKNTDYSANYDTLLRQRADLEETLMNLLTIYRDGAIKAPYDGMITSVDYDEDSTDSEVSVLTLYPNLRMSVTISVDETDIMSLEVGQEVDVTVSSVGDTTYTGEVTEISKAADTSSGVSAYSAVVELDVADGMLAGMTADVAVKIQGVEDALIIPVDALHQTSDIAFVYTSYDEKTQQYGGMVEVTTGISNDNYVEIISGLQEGDVVYYTEAQQNNFFSMMGGMSGGGGVSYEISGGSMPDMGGGNMPSGMSDRGGNSGGMPNMGGR